MKRTARNFLSSALLLTLLFLLASCEGDEGPTGPAGPAGEAAEFTTVIVGFTVAEAGIMGSGTTLYDVDVPEITQDVIDNGAVLVYINSNWNTPPGDEWILMPLSLTVGGDFVSFGMTFSPGVATFWFNTPANDWPYPDHYLYTYRIVILSEPVKAGVNVASFEDLRAHYRH